MDAHGRAISFGAPSEAPTGQNKTDSNGIRTTSPTLPHQQKPEHVMYTQGHQPLYQFPPRQQPQPQNAQQQAQLQQLQSRHMYPQSQVPMHPQNQQVQNTQQPNSQSQNAQQQEQQRIQQQIRQQVQPGQIPLNPSLGGQVGQPNKQAMTAQQLQQNQYPPHLTPQRQPNTPTQNQPLQRAQQSLQQQPLQQQPQSPQHQPQASQMPNQPLQHSPMQLQPNSQTSPPQQHQALSQHQAAFQAQTQPSQSPQVQTQPPQQQHGQQNPHQLHQGMVPLPATPSPATGPAGQVVPVAPVVAGVMTKEQLYQLKAQIIGYKYISKNLPLPQQVIAAIKQGANIANQLQQQQQIMQQQQQQLLQQQQQQQQHAHHQQQQQQQQQQQGAPLSLARPPQGHPGGPPQTPQALAHLAQTHPHLAQGPLLAQPSHLPQTLPPRPGSLSQYPIPIPDSIALSNNGIRMLPQAPGINQGVPVPIMNVAKPLIATPSPIQFPAPIVEELPERVDALILMEGRDRMVHAIISDKRETTMHLLAAYNPIKQEKEEEKVEEGKVEEGKVEEGKVEEGQVEEGKVEEVEKKEEDEEMEDVTKTDAAHDEGENHTEHKKEIKTENGHGDQKELKIVKAESLALLAAGDEKVGHLTIELKCANLLELQRRLRRELVDEYYKPQPLPTSEDVHFLHDIMSDRSKKNRPNFWRDIRHSPIQLHRFAEDQETYAKQSHAKLQNFLNNVLQHSKDFREYHTARQTRMKKLARTVLAYHNNQEKRELQRREKQERERLRALKANDEEAYMQLLEETKNERLNELLNQTNEYLRKISALVQKSKESHGLKDDEELVLFPEIVGGGASAEAKEGSTEDGEKPASAAADAPPAAKPLTHTYYTSAHSIQEQIGEQPELLEGGQLKPYQMVGLQWLVSLYNNKLNGILADEMGLGKTIQTIALITYLMEKKMNHGPYLIVVPLSTLANWNMEFEKWAPKVVRVLYKGAPKIRKELYDAHIYTGKFNVVITTYEYIIKDKSSLSKVKWNYIIIDEGHRMKNHNCKLSNILGSAYTSRHRLLLTGTPLQNSLPELWSLLNFLLPSIFDCVASFEQWFNAPFSNALTGDVEMNEEEKLLIIHRLHKVLRPFLLRRLKNEVESQLPEKTEKVLKCEMSAMQRRMYSLMHDKGIMRTGPSSAGTKGLMNTLMQLRKICNHPYLFREDGIWDQNDDLIRCSGKFELLDRIFPKLMASGHRVLIFSQMTSLLNILEDYFNYRKIMYLRLDGSTKADDRGVLLEKFNAPNSPYFVFVLSTRAGGLGLNLQSADTVILFDSDWNPQIDLQAQDRAHRIGQTNEVRVLRLVCENSIEERILARANFKLDIDAKIIQAGKFDNKSSAQERRDMLEFLMTKEEGRVENEVVPTDEEINEMIARTDEEFDLFQKMDVEREVARSRTNSHRLMQEYELPKWLLEEPSAENTDDISLIYGRGFRERPKVDYDDGLTDKQWEKKLIEYDEGSTPPSTPPSSKRKRAKSYKSEDQQFVDEEEDDETPTPKRKSTSQQSTPSNSRLRGSASKQKTPRETPSSAKRAKKVVSSKPEDAGQNRVKTLMDTLWDTLRNATDEEGRQYSVLFFRLPSKKAYPDYYRVIAKPIDMKMIKSRHGKYASITEWVGDFNLMFSNAQEFNMPDSQVYNDAVFLQNLFNTEYKKLFADVSSPKPGASVVSPVSPAPATPPHNVSRASTSKRTPIESPASSDDDAPPAKRAHPTTQRTRSMLNDDDDDYDSQDD